ncbi:LGFP repeat-containing protein [Runella sp.]|uniref:LGFP repeat-containing protein n=1 Tax=Runella sp. TaxID=1960881 RepID=UPI003D125D30
MKTIFNFRLLLACLSMISLLQLSSCFKKKSKDPAPAVDEYKTAIEAKYKALGWDKDGHAPFQGTGIIKTAAGKGYVQYYAFGGRKTAIYYFEGKGAYAMDTEEMVAYDNAEQDKFALVVSDPKGTATGGCAYNDILTTDGSEGIITCQNLIYGDIYKKYKEVNRWDGPLGLPTSGVLPTPAQGTDKGTFVTFKNGGIWNTPTIKTQAVWGKAYKMWVAQDWERGWLKFPITSCDAGKVDNLQSVDFQGGSVKTGPTCGAYFNKLNETVYQNGAKATNVSNIPCY